MGDLRNKFAKMAVTERIQAMQRRLEGKRPTSGLPRCRCGHSAQDTTLWGWSGVNKVNAGVFCASCLPNDLRSVLGIIE